MSAPSKRPKLSPTPIAASVQEPTCIIHDDNCKSEDIILLSELKNPEERFKKIHDVRAQRLAEPADSVHRKGSICEQVPAEYSSDMKYGYHRECYQKFTANLSRLKGEVATDIPEQSTSTLPRARRSTQERFIFKPDCIFCRKEERKKVKSGGQWTTEYLSKFEFGGGIFCFKRCRTEK